MVFFVILSLEGWSTKAKEAPSPHEVRLILLDTNAVFQYFRNKLFLDRQLMDKLVLDRLKKMWKMLLVKKQQTPPMCSIEYMNHHFSSAEVAGSSWASSPGIRFILEILCSSYLIPSIFYSKVQIIFWGSLLSFNNCSRAASRRFIVLLKSMFITCKIQLRGPVITNISLKR